MRTDELVAEGAILAMLAMAGLVIAAGGRRQVNARWLAIAGGLCLSEDFLLTRGYGLLPRVIGGGWNWQGKLLALAATLAIAALPAFGWRQAGLRLAQRRGSLVACLPVAALYCALFVALAFAFPGGPATREEIAFQLTMPGLEEECFYRGLLLLALDRAFPGRVRLAGVEWGWGAAVSSALFGLVHAFGFAQRHVSFEPMVFCLTAGPSLLAVWLRYRSGSVLVPILIHNFGNAIGLLLGARP